MHQDNRFAPHAPERIARAVAARKERMHFPRRSPDEIKYRTNRGRLAILGDEYERAGKRLHGLQLRYDGLLAIGRGTDAAQLRKDLLEPLEERIAGMHERMKALEAMVAAHEQATDRAQEPARLRILNDELRRRQERLQAAEFEVEKAREAMREIRQELEADRLTTTAES